MTEKAKAADARPGLWREAHIAINGTPLTFAQSMMFRVALEAYAMQLRVDGLGDDKHGRSMAAGYLARIEEIRKLVFAHVAGASEPEMP